MYSDWILLLSCSKTAEVANLRVPYGLIFRGLDYRGAAWHPTNMSNLKREESKVQKCKACGARALEIEIKWFIHSILLLLWSGTQQEVFSIQKHYLFSPSFEKCCVSVHILQIRYPTGTSSYHVNQCIAFSHLQTTKKTFEFVQCSLIIWDKLLNLIWRAKSSETSSKVYMKYWKTSSTRGLTNENIWESTLSSQSS